MNLANWLQRTAVKTPDRAALFFGTELVADYGTFNADAASVAAALQARGIGPGDRVAIFMKNVPDYLIVEYAAWYAGAAVVPINAKLHAREAAWIIEDSGATVVFATPGGADDLAAIQLEIPIIDVSGDDFADMKKAQPLAVVTPRAPGDMAWLFYTSGTTGKPKGVIITHDMLIGMALCYFPDVDQVRAEDSTIYAAPMSHGAGLYNLMHVLVGASHVFPPSGGFDEAEIFELARHYGSAHLFAAPTMVKRLTQMAKASGQSGTGLRTITYGGGPMYVADIIEAVDHFGPVFVQIYGQGECPMAVTALSRSDVADRAHPNWRERLISVGRAQSLVEVMIGDAHGQAMAPGETGEIMVRGDLVMPGYWNNPDASAKTIVDGWLLTGDMGFLDADGYLTLQDRSKDMIISGGTNIYPREVEEALMFHDGVAEVSVVGRPEPEWGEDVVAFVVRAEGSNVDEAALDAHCLDQIARFKRPKAYFWVSELPKNNYGKVLKTELRERLTEMSDG
ncbi:MAG: AMP-binding protein [Marinosulfonomonas sp.]|nr:AMP-binding protein [Marinosulfonomonas sp.]